MTRQLVPVLQALYESEINASISCLWAGGWTVRVGGDENEGWRSTANFENEDLDQAAVWLAAEAKRLYPESRFAREHPN